MHSVHTGGKKKKKNSPAASRNPFPAGTEALMWFCGGRSRPTGALKPTGRLLGVQGLISGVLYRRREEGEAWLIAQQEITQSEPEVKRLPERKRGTS